MSEHRAGARAIVQGPHSTWPVGRPSHTASLLQHGVADTGGRSRFAPAADRETRLEWLRTLPGYRELVRARLHAAAKAAETRALRVERRDGFPRPSNPSPPAGYQQARVERGLAELLGEADWFGLSADER